MTAIQPDFYEWLEEDGLVLPKGSGAGVVGGEDEASESEEEDPDEEDDEEAEGALRARDFSVLDEHIRGIIERYDGEVFPKMDWSAPRDAAWILPGQTLRCTTPADIYLLLKSSDFVAKDVEQAKEAMSVSPVATATTATRPLRLNLVLKRHFPSLQPSHEFRCFVRAGQFVAACQRDSGSFYDFLQPSDVKRDIRGKLRDFWQTHLQDRLTLSKGTQNGALVNGSGGSNDEGSLQDYIWDVYLTRDRSRVFLVDINPYLPRTDALLWDWDELEQKAKRSWNRSHGFFASDLDDSEAPTTSAEGQDDDVPSNAAIFGDEDQDSEEEGSDDDDDDDDDDEDELERDPRGEPFVRIYTDGRPPTTHYEPWPDHGDTTATETSSAPNGHTANGSLGASASRTPRQAPLPTLRLFSSQSQAQQAMGGAPTYVANMAPREAIDVSQGSGMDEFARVWSEQHRGD